VLWLLYRDCPGVFARFVADPPTDKATIQLKQQSSTSSPPQQQQQQGELSGAEIVLSGQELQQLQQQLLLTLSGSSTAAAGSNGSNGGSSNSRLVQVRPVGSSSSSAATGAIDSSRGRKRGGVAARALELVVDGSIAAVLQPWHVKSLVTVLDDLGSQLPKQYSTSQQLKSVQVGCCGDAV
jgi:hypothetical protein